jgi:DNA-binding protein HU-beta
MSSSRKKCLFFGKKRDSVLAQRNFNSESFAMAAKKAPAAAKSAAKTPKAAAAPKVGATVTLKHIAAALSESHDLPKKQADAMLGEMVGLVTKHLKKGDKIRINGLGVLQVRKRAARMGRNPATGEAIKIKASKKVAFRVAKELKEAV